MVSRCCDAKSSYSTARLASNIGDVSSMKPTVNVRVTVDETGVTRCRVSASAIADVDCVVR